MGLGANVNFKTSITEPFQFDPIQVPGGGVTGLTVSPGKMPLDSLAGARDRTRQPDLKSIQKPSEAELSAQDGGQTLRDRFRRAASLLCAIRRERGVWAAVVLFQRIVLRKGPMLIRQFRAARQHAAIRADIAAVRAELAGRVPFLALLITGGLGDMLVIARFLRDLRAEIGPFRFDVFCPTPAPAAWALSAVAGFRSSYLDILFEPVRAEYDTTLRVSQFALVYHESVRWSTVRLHPKLESVIDNIIRFRPQIDIFIQHHPWTDNALARSAVSAGNSRRDFLQHIAGVSYGGERLPVASDPDAVARFGLTPWRYVTVHNGFDSGFIISGDRATKCYPHFGAVVAHLKAALPHITFVQIGSVTSEPVPECDVNLLNRTTFAEVAGLLARALVHLDNESGLVHLASCLGTRSAVVFGPTPSDYFGYPDNINIDPPVCGNCWWLTRTWMDTCVKGDPAPRCLVEQDPQVVAKRVLAALLPTGRGGAPVRSHEPLAGATGFQGSA